MASRPDIRELARNVREAFGDADRETLLEVLTFVVKEYVVEGPPPMLIHQAETLTDMQGKTFAQLISALQTRFDHPELAMFVVDGEQVGVRVGGVVHPLLPGRTPPAAEMPRPAAGVRVVETSVGRLVDTRPASPAQPAPQAAPAPQPGQAPPPTRGLSVRGRPNEGEAPPAAAPQPAAPAANAAQPAQSGAAPAQPGAPEKPEGSGDDASARFSLLELD